jgi:uncharacterized membrane protein YkvA (DUF1232 family)
MRLWRFVVLKKQLLEAWRLIRSSRVPLWLKLSAVGLAVLIVSPLDPLADIPVLGLIDDVALMGLLLGWFVRSATVHDDPLTIDA